MQTYVSTSKSLTSYIQGIQIMSESTANQYSSRLVKFERFLRKEFNENLDNLIDKLKRNIRDPYEVLISNLHLQCTCSTVCWNR